MFFSSPIVKCSYLWKKIEEKLQVVFSYITNVIQPYEIIDAKLKSFSLQKLVQ
jgi:hypothetical protein